MNGGLPEPPPLKHDPLAPFRLPKFNIYLSSRLLSAVGSTMLQAIFAWQVYDISGSALNLGLLGLARLFSSLGLAMVGGATADAYNRRTIIMIAQTVPMTCGLILAVATLGGWISLPIIYGLAFTVGMAAAFESPANAALLPGIVPRETFAQAVTIATSARSLGAVTGPAVGGALIAILGVGPSYFAYSGCLICSLAVLSFLRYHQEEPEQKRSVSIAAIKEGVQFVLQRQVILGAMTLDLFAVIFGGAKAMLPIYATDILHAGATGYGVLLSSLELGAFAMAGVLIIRPPIVRVGRALVWSVVAFGLLTILFGFSRIYWVSIGLYFSIGAVDQISVVMRHAIIQLATPDHLRGRVSSVSQVFISSSNQLGDVESGFVAWLTTVTFAVVSGGVGAVAVVGLVAAKLPQLYRYRVSQRDANEDDDGTGGGGGAAEAEETAAVPGGG